MFRSTRSFNLIRAFFVGLFVLVIVAGAFALFRPQSVIPVAGADNEIKAVSAAWSTQRVDLGAGYWLETDARGGRIIAPETIVRPADKTFDLGAGYRLVITAAGDGQILPPARPSTYYKRTDLGAGYVLEETAYYGQIIPPSNPVKFQVQVPAVHKQDLGGGYWLVTGPDGSQIVREGSR